MLDIHSGIAFAAVMGVALWIAIAQSAKREERLRKSGIREIDKMDGTKTVVQAKRYSKNVGFDAIQQVVGSMKHYGASGSWVVTNKEFTDAAYKLAASNGGKLINFDKMW